MSEAKQFIDLLESQGLIDKEVIAELRRQLAESKGRVTPEAVAKVLVENGQLTRFQATKLIASLRDDQPTAGSEKPPVRSESKDDLDLIPDDLLAEPRRSGSDKTPPAAVLIEEESVAPQEEPSQKVVLPKKSKRKASRAPAPVDDAFTTALPRATTKLPVAKKNNWDQFRIYGFLSILLLLLVPLAGLGYWMWKGSSSDWLDMSKKAYEGRDYELAQARYSEFLKRFPSDENASLARVRIGLSKIRHAAERSTDPAEALKVSKETLPTLVEESALTAERPDLASALLTIAEKFNQKADNAKAIDEKKTLVGGLEEHLTLIQNPQYVGTQERNQNEARIKRIEESRDRIVRDIKRSEDLVATVAAMKESLAKQEVDMAYAARRALVRNYPQLETEPQIVELVAEATRIQQSLVGSSTVQVQSTANPPSAVPALPNANLAKRRGGPVAAEVDGTVVVRAKDAAYGLDARSGDVKWRKYLGSQWQGDPLRVAKELESDWIANFPEQGLVRRMQTADGSALWEASLGGPVLSPMVDRDDLFVASRDGKLCALDLQTGMSRWGKQLPQPVDVSPGFYGGREFGYVLGNHSNLYVVSRRSGACDEVFYLGHREGSVKVPPVYALGHVLIFENEGPGYCLIRVLKCDDQGKNLTPGQPSIRLRGHVVVPAQVEGRRVVLVTDLGEVVILDIEPSNATDQVTKLASRVASETQPRDLWPLLDKNELWLTGRNFTRLKVVVSKQLLDPEWVKEDQDQFTGPAQRLGPLVVHSRILRG
ncbi:MAG: PQQ-binding-like beta-propeller repeat protein, partial [Pirellulaceae bacterium]